MLFSTNSATALSGLLCESAMIRIAMRDCSQSERPAYLNASIGAVTHHAVLRVARIEINLNLLKFDVRQVRAEANLVKSLVTEEDDLRPEKNLPAGSDVVSDLSARVKGLEGELRMVQ